MVKIYYIFFYFYIKTLKEGKHVMFFLLKKNKISSPLLSNVFNFLGSTTTSNYIVNDIYEFPTHS